MSARDGGPAFPTTTDAPRVQVMPDGTTVPLDIGMSLRDWFAGQALVGYLAPDAPTRRYHEQMDAIAHHCYALADAMLAARYAPESAQEPADGEIGPERPRDSHEPGIGLQRRADEGGKR